MTLVHIHLLLNHWPIIGAFVGLGLFVIALAANSDHLKQTSLGFFAFLALLAIPTYMSGDVVNEVLKVPCQIVRQSRRVIHRVLHWNPQLPTFFRLATVLNC